MRGVRESDRDIRGGFGGKRERGIERKNEEGRKGKKDGRKRETL